MSGEWANIVLDSTIQYNLTYLIANDDSADVDDDAAGNTTPTSSTDDAFGLRWMLVEIEKMKNGAW